MSRRPGRAFEFWARDFLIAEGWSVKACARIPMRTSSGQVWMKGDDIFGTDLVAVKPGQKTLFVQCTLDSGVKKRLEEIRKHAWELAHQQVELWQRTRPAEVNVKLFTGADFVDDRKIIRGRTYRREDKP